MTQAINFLLRFIRNDEAQDLLEYGMLGALIAVVAVLTVTQIGQTITNILWVPIASNL